MLVRAGTTSEKRDCIDQSPLFSRKQAKRLIETEEQLKVSEFVHIFFRGETE